MEPTHQARIDWRSAVGYVSGWLLFWSYLAISHLFLQVPGRVAQVAPAAAGDRLSGP